MKIFNLVCLFLLLSTVLVAFPSWSEEEAFRYFSDQEEVRSFFHLRPKVYVTGISSGGGYAYYFAEDNPDRTAASAVHGAGLFNVLDPDLMKIKKETPFLWTCGMDDGRYGVMLDIYQKMKLRGFDNIETLWIPKVGHYVSKEALAATKEFFLRVKRGE